MTILGNLLRLSAIYIVYPAIVVGLFVFFGYSIYNLVKHAREMEKIRRITGALLPIVGLVFILVLTGQKNPVLNSLYSSLNNFGGLIVGLIIGISVIILGNYLKESDEEILPSLFTLFMSSIAAFVLFPIIRFQLGDLNYFLMGILIGGGATVVWKGIPNIMFAERYNPWIVKGKENHKDIAKEYLSQEVGLSPDEIDYIMENTGFIATLTAGNYVFNHYVDGVYLSAVTRGRASVSPMEAISTADRKQRNNFESVSGNESSALINHMNTPAKNRDALSIPDDRQSSNLGKVSGSKSSVFKKNNW